MATESRNKTLHYRKATITQGPKGQTLQALTATALKKLHVSKDRLHGVSGDDAAHLLINRWHSKQNFLFGTLILYSQDSAKLIANLDLSQDEIGLQELLASAVSDDKRAQFVDSIFYFGIHDNHVVVVQSALRSKDFEEHLNWLLTKSDVIAEHATVTLDADLPAPVRDRLMQAGVKKVRIGSDLEARPTRSRSTEDYDIRSTRYDLFGKAWNVLKAVLPKEVLGDLSLHGPIDDSKLKVTVELTYKNKTTREGQDLVNRIGKSLRHQDSEHVRVELVGGGTISGDKLRISAPVVVQSRNGILFEHDLFPKMREFLLSKVKDGEVRP